MRLSLIISWIVATVTRWHQHFEGGSSQRCPSKVIRRAQTRHAVFISASFPPTAAQTSATRPGVLYASGFLPRSQVIFFCGPSDIMEGNLRLIRCHYSQGPRPRSLQDYKTRADRTGGTLDSDVCWLLRLIGSTTGRHLRREWIHTLLQARRQGSCILIEGQISLP